MQDTSHSVWKEAVSTYKGEKRKVMQNLVLKTRSPLVVPAWYYGFWRKQYVFVFSISISLDFLIFHIWPATFWEHIVHMFWCSLKALWETRVDGKLSVLLKWVVQELELNSCHTPIELLSFINYFPCHLEQEWCHVREALCRVPSYPVLLQFAYYHHELKFPNLYLLGGFKCE